MAHVPTARVLQTDSVFTLSPFFSALSRNLLRLNYFFRITPHFLHVDLKISLPSECPQAGHLQLKAENARKDTMTVICIAKSVPLEK